MTPTKSIANFLATPSTDKFLKDILGERKGEFISNLIALTESNPLLKECNPADLMKCALNATALNLPLNANLGYAYVIPYKGIPQFQIGYKGLIQLAIRTGKYKHINATEIREGEISVNKITGAVEFFGERPDKKVVGYLAYLEMTNGFIASLYMTTEQIMEHAGRFSKTFANDLRFGKRTSKWSDELAQPAMCKKTVLKGLLSKYGLMTTEFARAITADNGGEEAQSETAVHIELQNEPQAEEEPMHQSEPADDDAGSIGAETEEKFVL